MKHAFTALVMLTKNYINVKVSNNYCSIIVRIETRRAGCIWCDFMKCTDSCESGTE